MRQHVGFHILSKDIESSQNVCGFCGSADSCDISICRGSGRGKTASEIPQSTCSYFEKSSLKSAAKSTKTSPCTNRPIECATCKRIFWSYNILKVTIQILIDKSGWKRTKKSVRYYRNKTISGVFCYYIGYFVIRKVIMLCFRDDIR